VDCPNSRSRGFYLRLLSLLVLPTGTTTATTVSIGQKINLKIALVQETFNPFFGGSQRRVYEISKRLVKRGHLVHIFTVRLDSRWPEEDYIDGIHVHRYMNPWYGFITSVGWRSVTDVMKYAILTLAKLSKRVDFDLYEANHCPLFPLMATWQIAKGKRKPLTATFHECWHNDWYKWAPNALTAGSGIILERITTMLPNILIAVSPLVKSRLTSLFGVPEGRIKVISNGVDPDPYPHTRPIKQFGKIVYVGRLNRHKRVDLLLQAYAEVKRRHQDVSLEILGDGTERGFLEKLAQSLELRNVVFRGKVSDREVVKALKSAWIKVLPSIREGQGIVLLEAMAAGTPCIAVKSGGCNAVADIIKNKETGLLARPNVPSISKKINLLLSDNDLWSRLREEGLDYVQEHTWEKITEQYEGLYKKLIEG